MRKAQLLCMEGLATVTGPYYRPQIVRLFSFQDTHKKNPISHRQPCTDGCVLHVRCLFPEASGRWKLNHHSFYCNRLFPIMLGHLFTQLENMPAFAAPQQACPPGYDGADQLLRY